MPDAADILARNHIVRVSTSKIGNQYTTCPACSHLRKKKSDRCLSVKILDDGIVWRCQHCGDKGGEYFDQHKSSRPEMVRGPQHQPGNSRSYGGLQRQAVQNWRR